MRRDGKIHVTVWNEYVSDRENPAAAAAYPEGIHGCLAKTLGEEPDFIVRTATLQEAHQGITRELLEGTDVLLWWSHIRQEEVDEKTVDLVEDAVRRGMGLIALHSAHYSKVCRRLLGTPMTLHWREGDREILWKADASHPIAAGVPDQILLPEEEMYGEPFAIPKPDDVVFLGWFAGGEAFRSGVTFHRGYGKIFYFQPGHETRRIYVLPPIRQILVNAIRWARPSFRVDQDPQNVHAIQPAAEAFAEKR